MANAVWLFFALPKWYFGSSLNPLAGGLPTGIPTSGVIALVAGLILVLWSKGGPNFTWILASLVVSQLYVSISGLFRGRLPSEAVDWPFGVFLLGQLTIVAMFIWRSREDRIKASLLSWFGITYASYAALIARMTLTDTWM